MKAKKNDRINNVYDFFFQPYYSSFTFSKITMDEIRKSEKYSRFERKLMQIHPLSSDFMCDYMVLDVCICLFINEKEKISYIRFQSVTLFSPYPFSHFFTLQSFRRVVTMIFVIELSSYLTGHRSKKKEKNKQY